MIFPPPLNAATFLPLGLREEFITEMGSNDMGILIIGILMVGGGGHSGLAAEAGKLSFSSSKLMLAAAVKSMVDQIV